MTQEQTPTWWKSWPGRLGHPEGSYPRDLQTHRAVAGLNRRRFLEAAGFALSLTAMSGCTRSPVQVALPLVDQPEGMVPGRSLQYATTCSGCPAGCGILARVRDGRPLKMEGMPEHPLSRGGLCAVGQALPMGLYDSQRLRHPLASGKPAEWAAVDRSITSELDRIASEKGSVRFVTSTINSPTLTESITKFLSRFADARHITWDSLSSSAILEAHLQTHGQRLLPHYDFAAAKVIVSFGADFLGTWISPVEFTSGWSRNRVPDPTQPEMSWHVQLEGRMSLTGSKADQRIRLHPQRYGAVLSQLYAAIARLAGVPPTNGHPGPAPLSAEVIAMIAERLWAVRGQSLVISDSQDTAAQVLVNGINHLLGNYGKTLDVIQPARQRLGSDSELLTLLEELKSGRVEALFVLGNDLTHHLASGLLSDDTLKKVGLIVSFAEREDDFASRAHYVCPDHHALESWGDTEGCTGVLSLSQPLLAPLGNTRSALESLARWSGGTASAYDIVRNRWEQDVFPKSRTSGQLSFQAFWDQAVHDGVVLLTVPDGKPPEFRSDVVQAVSDPGESDELCAELYARVGMNDSRHAHNPWLQELPDPITKVTWDNWVSLSPSAAEELGVHDGDVVRISAEGVDPLELPVVIQPGQHDGVICIPLYYGVRGTGRFAHIGPQWFEAKPTVTPGRVIGKNAAPLMQIQDGSVRRVRSGTRIERTGQNTPLATTQEHHRLEVPKHVAPPGAEKREPIQETTLAAFTRNPLSGKPEVHHDAESQLWPTDHPRHGHAWGMVIDLNACTGCSACMIACQAENNVPLVGRDEVVRQREMHWLRMDRYYSGDGDDVDVAHQPMMCQHCGNAPCETVCPVLATVHSSEGLNEQVYNRCVGTRYCANNCPYKVRRFNWFDYPHDDTLQNLILNPDVTVRSRGVMEKCSLCVHRIEEGRMESGRTGQPIGDGTIQTACQQSCPAQAIVFGDLNDPSSRVAQAAANPRQFGVLEEFNFQTVVSYLRMVRNRPDGGAPATDAAEGEHHV